MSLRALVVALAGLLSVGLPAAGIAQQAEQAPSSEFVEPEELEYPQAGTERPLELDVSFDYLWVARQGAGLVIAYAVDPEDWARAKQRDIALWINMYIPEATVPPTFAYAYHMPLDKREGVVEYPDWLSTLQAQTVAVCPLGTGPFDNLGLGRGYACDNLYMMPIHDELRSTGESVAFELSYYTGIPYYGFFPWFGPGL